MIVTIKSLINGKVSTFKLNMMQVKELIRDHTGKSGDLKTFTNSVELMFRCEVLSITHYI